MFTKPLMLAIVAACGVLSGAAAPAEKPDARPPEDDVRSQSFCCTDVHTDGTGEGCVSIGPENINSCDRVLTCGDKWIKKDGKVTCL